MGTYLPLVDSQVCAFVAAASMFLISVCRHIVFRSSCLCLMQFHSNQISIKREDCLAQLCSSELVCTGCKKCTPLKWTGAIHRQWGPYAYTFRLSKLLVMWEKL